MRSMTMGVERGTICAKARRWRRDPSVFKTGDERGMILIDYLQMIKRQPGSKAQNKQRAEVTESSGN